MVLIISFLKVARRRLNSRDGNLLKAAKFLLWAEVYNYWKRLNTSCRG